MPRQPQAATRVKRPVKTEPRLSRTRQPDDASAEVWQAGLRRQFGREQAFGLEPLGAEPEFIVSNPQSGGRYRVAIRGSKPGDNFCACADFAINEQRSADPAGAPVAWIERDPQTGRDVLKLPLPEPQTVLRLADALSGLLAGLRRA